MYNVSSLLNTSIFKFHFICAACFCTLVRKTFASQNKSCYLEKKLDGKINV